MSKTDEQWEFLKDVARLIRYADAIGLKLTGGELWRPTEMQRRYVDTGRSWTMTSKHLERLAVDFNFFIAGSHEPIWAEHPLVSQLGRYWESLTPKNKWGGNFERHPDRPHFERNV